MEQSIKLASNIANIASELTPEELTSTGSRLLQSSVMFSRGIDGLEVPPDEAADILESAMANERTVIQGAVDLP